MSVRPAQAAPVQRAPVSTKAGSGPTRLEHVLLLGERHAKQQAATGISKEVFTFTPQADLPVGETFAHVETPPSSHDEVEEIANQVAKINAKKSIFSTRSAYQGFDEDVLVQKYTELMQKRSDLAAVRGVDGTIDKLLYPDRVFTDKPESWWLEDWFPAVVVIDIDKVRTKRNDFYMTRGVQYFPSVRHAYLALQIDTVNTKFKDGFERRAAGEMFDKVFNITTKADLDQYEKDIANSKWKDRNWDEKRDWVRLELLVSKFKLSTLYKRLITSTKTHLLEPPDRLLEIARHEASRLDAKPWWAELEKKPWWAVFARHEASRPDAKPWWDVFIR